MFTVDVSDRPEAVDAAPRKAKPFLKRGEGVNKRLNAYKLRDEAAELRKQRVSSHSSNKREPWAATSDQFEADASLSKQTGQQRRTWQHQPQSPRQSAAAHAVEDEVLVAKRPAAAAVMQSRSSAAPAAEQGRWTPGQDVEVSKSFHSACAPQLQHAGWLLRPCCCSHANGPSGSCTCA